VVIAREQSDRGNLNEIASPSARNDSVKEFGNVASEVSVGRSKKVFGRSDIGVCIHTNLSDNKEQTRMSVPPFSDNPRVVPKKNHKGE